MSNLLTVIVYIVAISFEFFIVYYFDNAKVLPELLVYIACFVQGILAYCAVEGIHKLRR